MSEIIHNSARNRFEIQRDELTATADYELQNDILTVTHIIVPPSLRGGGIASELALACVEHVRENQLRLVPQCPFMSSYLERHPQYADVVGRE